MRLNWEPAGLLSVPAGEDSLAQIGLPKARGGAGASVSSAQLRSTGPGPRGASRRAHRFLL